MSKGTKILVCIFLFFLFLDIYLGYSYWSLKEKFLKNNQAPTSFETITKTAEPLLPPPGKLINPSVVGMQSHKIGNEDIYELVGWILETDEEKKEIVVGQKDPPSSRKVFIPQNVTIRQALVDEENTLKHQPKSFADLVPEKTRVNILCSNSSCTEAKIVTIIETQP